MTILLASCLGVLVVAAGISLIRLQRGPTNLDRAVALDVVTAITIGIVIVVSAWQRRLDLLPLLVVLTSVGFLSSTVIARFSRKETLEERRILTPQEVAALDAEDVDQVLQSAPHRNQEDQR